ncbi:MAG TPA: leucyl aminopeptidase [Steroidobacteraceae bacterium]|nr:leucyl aminopeptidase [Steroidobacteraceae bacterium]
MMQFDVWSKSFSDLAVDCIAAGIFEDGKLGTEAAALDRATDGRLKGVIERGDFSGRTGETLLLSEAGSKSARILLVGLGPEAGYTRKGWRRACTAALTAAGRTRVRSVALAIERPAAKQLDDYYFGRCVAEITGNVLYRTNDLKTGKKPPTPAIALVVAGPVRAAGVAQARRGLEHGRALAIATGVQRDLGNLPPNICTPTYLANFAKGLAKRHGSVKAKVLDLAAIKREKMGCFLAVSQGSAEPPRFIVLDYQGPKATRTSPIVLVGKGITFDTGGISLKDPGAMDEMKFDMMGAASVIAAFSFLAEAKLPIRVVGLVPTCENMPDGVATRPGDVVISASGQSVEILNTDAEGRLILCDALHYARRFDPSIVVDMATLTGACVIALGAHHSGVMGNDDELAGELVAAGVRADDRAWQLPLTEEYAEQLKTNFADMANIGGREGGAITAAAFLGKYTQGMKWAHMDIAGTAYQGGPHKGATGRPMPLLTDFLVKRANAG